MEVFGLLRGTVVKEGASELLLGIDFNETGASISKLRKAFTDGYPVSHEWL